ncbi:hypothetical protein [Kitasatospora terrestris]|uniref:Uncharacterized protein n=1 Tax=Kitasatospora terrestris TaxID=258051 RepID=A0ABP9DFM8_9ACTN
MTGQSPLAPFHLDETGESDPSHCVCLFDGDADLLHSAFHDRELLSRYIASDDPHFLSR